MIRLQTKPAMEQKIKPQKTLKQMLRPKAQTTAEPNQKKNRKARRKLKRNLPVKQKAKRRRLRNLLKRVKLRQKKHWNYLAEKNKSQHLCLVRLLKLVKGGNQPKRKIVHKKAKRHQRMLKIRTVKKRHMVNYNRKFFNDS